MEPGDGQSIAQHADVKCLEEQMDQNDDRHPRYRVSNDDSVPESAVRRQSVVLHQRAAMQTFRYHGRLPGIVPRSGRLANRCRSLFPPKPCDDSTNSCALAAICHQAVAYRSAFDEQSRAKQRCDGHLLPMQRREVCSIEFRESNNGFCSAIFEYAWQRRVTRNSLTRQIQTKRFRTNRNIASHNCASDSVPASRETYFTFAPNFAQDFGKSLRPASGSRSRTC